MVVDAFAVGAAGLGSTAATAASGSHTGSAVSFVVISAIAAAAPDSAAWGGRMTKQAVERGSSFNKRKESQPLKTPACWRSCRSDLDGSSPRRRTGSGLPGLDVGLSSFAAELEVAGFVVGMTASPELAEIDTRTIVGPGPDSLLLDWSIGSTSWAQRLAQVFLPAHRSASISFDRSSFCHHEIRSLRPLISKIHHARSCPEAVTGSIAGETAELEDIASTVQLGIAEQRTRSVSLDNQEDFEGDVERCPSLRALHLVHHSRSHSDAGSDHIWEICRGPSRCGSSWNKQTCHDPRAHYPSENHHSRYERELVQISRDDAHYISYPPSQAASLQPGLSTTKIFHDERPFLFSCSLRHLLEMGELLDHPAPLRPDLPYYVDLTYHPESLGCCLRHWPSIWHPDQLHLSPGSRCCPPTCRCRRSSS